MSKADPVTADQRRAYRRGMTNLSSYTWLHGAPTSAHSTKHFARKAAEVALGLLVAAALTGAWLALFTFAPFDFTPPRVG